MVTPHARTYTMDLSPEQQRVVDHRDGHLQVIACAGSGKTESISRRVAHLIAEGAEPSSIVAFTFTDRAATELKECIVRRVKELMGAGVLDRLGPMFVGTIHSYCFKLLQDHVPEYGNYDVLDEHRQAGLLSREHTRLGLDRLGAQHWQPIRDFARNVDVIDNELIEPAQLIGQPLGDCLIRYRDTLTRYRFLTFGQIIRLAVEALDRPTVFDAVHGPLRHLIVDEYQDINPAQEALIELLGQAPVQVCVVGDDDQSIYQWRGSDISNILTFTSRCAPVSTRPLATNRRSRPQIVAAANGFATSIQQRLAKAMTPARETQGPGVVCWRAETEDGEADVIASTIAQLHGRGFRYADIGVLYRSVRTSATPLIDALRDRRIPVRCAGRTGLFLQPEIRVLAQTYAWLLDFDWKVERYATAQPVQLDPLLTEYRSVFGGGREIAGLEQYLRDWKSTVPDNQRPVNLVGDYYRLLRVLAIQELNPDDPNDSARLGALGRFSEVLADFESVTRRGRHDENGQRVYRGGTDRGRSYYQRLYNYLQHYALDAYEEFEGEESVELDAVDVLTVHQAKGLEWPIVFAPCLVEGRFPSRYAGQPQQWLLPDAVFPADVRARYEGGDNEERRLFYVAMTRAREVLYLSRFERRKNRFRPSPFLLEMAGGDPARRSDLPLADPSAVQTPDELPALAVSFSELAAYEDCPLRYRFSQVLGFQPQLAVELGYGRAIHHVLRHIAELARELGRVPTRDEVRGILDNAFYLPFANRPAYAQLYAAAERLIDRYLTDYSHDLLRVWATERPFELHLEGGTLSGRADLILDEEGGKIDSLAIVDYKTATDERGDDFFAFQLAIYSSAARGEGLTVEAAYLHQLKEGTRQSVGIDDAVTAQARSRATDLVAGVRSASYPHRPDRAKCRRCDVRAVCRHAACSRWELYDA
jgi:DNA helicase-2/ATP-dependent DNA helicase PcrA